MPELSGFALQSFRTALDREGAGELTVCAPVSGEILNLCELRGIGQDLLLIKVYQLAHSTT